MQAIRSWLELHHQSVDECLHYNESFVFFQDEDGGPYGSLGVEVTAPLYNICRLCMHPLTIPCSLLRGKVNMQDGYPRLAAERFI